MAVDTRKWIAFIQETLRGRYRAKIRRMSANAPHTSARTAPAGFGADIFAMPGNRAWMVSRARLFGARRTMMIVGCRSEVNLTYRSIR